MYHLESTGTKRVKNVILNPGITNIGRSTESGIDDMAVSRKQVKVRVAKNGMVKIKSIGKHPDKLNGDDMELGKEYEIKEGDEVVVVSKEAGFAFKLIKTCDEPARKKRKGDNDDEEDGDNEGDEVQNNKDGGDDVLNNGVKFPENNEDEDVVEEDISKSKNVTETNENNDKQMKKEKDTKIDEFFKKPNKKTPEKNSQKIKENTQETAEDNTNEDPKINKNESFEIENKGDTPLVQWTDDEKLMVCLWVPPMTSLTPYCKMACFDLDGTIISTKSGRVFPKDVNDWRLWSGQVKMTVKKLSFDHSIVFFTNQNSIEKGRLPRKEFRSKVEKIAAELNVPLRVFVSTGKGFYRKPSVGMWESLCKQMGSVQIDLKGSFYVGDAAGRPKGWCKGGKKDHSCCDRLFALNVGVSFCTPEEYFSKHKPHPFVMPTFDPRKVQIGSGLYDVGEVDFDKEVEVIVMVGSPASGKSSFVKKHLLPRGYVHVSRDLLGSQQKCLTLLHECLREGRSVVVDNTNPGVQDRSRWIEASKGHRIRCFLMNTTYDHCLHNEAFRQMIDKQHKAIGHVVFNVFRNQYKEPSKSEGFDDVIKVNFVADLSSEHLRLYQNYLVA